MGTIRIGIGGWNFEPWRGRFYPPGHPQKRELEYAGQHLTSIEINSTYYGAQKPETFLKWANDVPNGFKFAVKGPRFATNRRNLAEGRDSVERFLNGGVLALGDRLGPINWQFAETKVFAYDDFAGFLDLLPDAIDGQKLRHAVEVRHPSFRDPAFVDLLRGRNIAVVVAGDSKFVQIADQTADFTYVRIMGTVEAEPLGYGPDQLDLWAGRAREWAAGGAPAGLDHAVPPVPAAPRDVFLYVISGHKDANPQAAMALIDRVG